MGYSLSAVGFINGSDLTADTANLHVNGEVYKVYSGAGTIEIPDVSSASISFYQIVNFKKFYVYGALNTFSGYKSISFTLTGNSKLYWTSGSSSVGYTMYLVRMTYNVSYSTEHGEAPSSKSGISDLTGAALPTLTADGYVFQGWYYEPTFTTQAQIGDALSSNTTLYAKWEVARVIGTVDITTLESALTASADAIREKSESTELIDFDMEGGTGFAEAIEAIPSGGPQGEYNIIPILKEDGTQRLQITDSGSFSLKVKTITQNGSYDPTEEDVNGYSSVIVAIPTYDGTVV